MILLIYVSAATELMSDAELRDLLTVARRNNEELGVSGMLLYRNGNFLQVLEGEEDVVDPLYKKIAQDERHQSVIRIYRMPIKERTFPDWTMGFSYITDDTIPTLEGYQNFFSHKFDINEFNKEPSAVRNLLVQFRENIR